MKYALLKFGKIGKEFIATKEEAVEFVKTYEDATMELKTLEELQ